MNYYVLQGKRRPEEFQRMLENVPTPGWKNSMDYAALSWTSTFYIQLAFQRLLEKVPTALENVPTRR